MEIRKLNVHEMPFSKVPSITLTVNFLLYWFRLFVAYLFTLFIILSKSVNSNTRFNDDVYKSAVIGITLTKKKNLATIQREIKTMPSWICVSSNFHVYLYSYIYMCVYTYIYISLEIRITHSRTINWTVVAIPSFSVIIINIIVSLFSSFLSIWLNYLYNIIVQSFS